MCRTQSRRRVRRENCSGGLWPPRSSFWRAESAATIRAVQNEARVVDEFARDPDASLSEVLATLLALETASIPGVIELAPAYTTVAVFFDPARVAPDEIPETPFDWLRAKIEKVLKSRPALQKQKTESDAIEVPVCYEGEFAPDLAEVARHAGLSEDEVVRRH